MVDAQARRDIATALQRIPLFDGVDPEEVPAVGIGDGPNRRFRLDHAERRFVLRIPGPARAWPVDRRTEEHAARTAASLGLNAEVLFFDASDGLQLSRYIDGGQPMTAESFRDAGAVRRAAAALSTLHRQADPFRRDFDPAALFDERRGRIAACGRALPSGYAEATALVAEIAAAIACRALPRMPSHCGALAAHCIDTGVRMAIVDWERAGNADPIWDLAALAAEAEFDPDQEAVLLAAYFGGGGPASARGRSVLYQAVADLLRVQCSLLHGDADAAESAAVAMRLARCLAVAGRADFGASMDAVRRG